MQKVKPRLTNLAAWAAMAKWGAVRSARPSPCAVGAATNGANVGAPANGAALAAIVLVSKFGSKHHARLFTHNSNYRKAERKNAGGAVR